MDDIYGDLENYNEVDAIDKLRKENKELQFKLEECISSRDKLQKDFDKIASEYTKLEMNYSSLLRTARAEVERKTQIITSLNNEKDMMVLNSIQNSTKIILNIRRNMTRERSNTYKSNRKDNSSDFGKGNKNMDLSETKKRASERAEARTSAEDNRMASIDTVSSLNTDETNIDSRPGKLEGYAEKNNEGKENITKVKSRALSIRNRRKSMPAVGMQFAKFSSDEEFEGNYSGGEAIHKEWPARDDKNRRAFDRVYHDKHGHKVSETSGIDDKYSSYHESSRETNYKGKSNRHSDRYRNRDKYDLSLRYRKRFSPDRQSRTGQRDHSDERLQRSEYGRHRVLESPPPDRYATQRKKDSPPPDRYETQRKNRDRRFNHEREHPFDERPRHRHERHAVKHKNLSDYDEPATKRVRTESLGRPVEDVRWHTEIDHAEDPAITKMVEDYHTSCQSPDYMLAEALSTQPIKEIMNTATTPLEDPRIASKRYVTNNEDGKVVLSTLTGRNVDLIVVDKSKWDIDEVDVPDALLRPPQDTDEIVKQMYMDIDNPASNMSIESGEIHSETNDVHLGDVVTESLFNDCEIERNTRYHGNEQTTVDAKVKHTQSSKPENPPKPYKYKIPKVKDKSFEPPDLQIPLSKLIKQKIDENSPQEHLKKKKPCNSRKTRHIDVQSEDIQTFKGENVQELSKNTDLVVEATSSYIPERILTNREIVEGDLELSDENSDYVAKPKVIPSKDVHKSNDFHKNEKETIVKEILENVVIDKQAFQDSSDNLKNDKVSICVEVERTVTEPGDPIIETNKKKKSKRKTKKDKGTTSKDIESAGVNKNLDKKKRPKKDKETKIKDLKPKFSDLFGDSSTVDLITPDDLGIPVQEQQFQVSRTYVPIFEDAQDAIDVNVDKIDKNESVLPKVDTTDVDASPSITKEQLKFVIDDVNKVNPETGIITIDEAELVPTDEIIKTVHKNVNIETLCKASDIVKTIIVSTGVQLSTILDSNVNSNLEQIQIDLVDRIEKPQDVILSKLQEVPIQALATSTPHKNLLIKNTNTDIILAESNCNTSDSRVVRNDASSTIDQSSASIGLDSQTDDTDVPDVRIFVRRRRKVIKK